LAAAVAAGRDQQIPGAVTREKPELPGSSSRTWLDQLLHDREHQPAMPSGRGGVGLPEAVEEVWQELRPDPLARVRDGDFEARVFAPPAPPEPARP
jgi:hypothetical protein